MEIGERMFRKNRHRPPLSVSRCGGARTCREFRFYYIDILFIANKVSQVSIIPNIFMLFIIGITEIL
ncbi:MAG: hypothetical protein C6W57_07585 [Caldibacillus debilis]|nr:MAG: hypothetical protein C6W57_07585 [Caldibacillus debilis]